MVKEHWMGAHKTHTHTHNFSIIHFFLGNFPNWIWHKIFIDQAFMANRSVSHVAIFNVRDFSKWESGEKGKEEECCNHSSVHLRFHPATTFNCHGRSCRAKRFIREEVCCTSIGCRISQISAQEKCWQKVRIETPKIGRHVCPAVEYNRSTNRVTQQWGRPPPHFPSHPTTATTTATTTTRNTVGR